MTPEQRENWAKHQRSVTPEVEAQIEAATVPAAQTAITPAAKHAKLIRYYEQKFDAVEMRSLMLGAADYLDSVDASLTAERAEVKRLRDLVGRCRRDVETVMKIDRNEYQTSRAPSHECRLEIMREVEKRQALLAEIARITGKVQP